MGSHTSALALALLAGIPMFAGASGDKPKQKDEAARLNEEVQWFAARSTETQHKILDGIKKSVAALDDPYLKSIAAQAARGAALAKKKEVETKIKTSPEGSLSLAKELPFPIFKDYVFGARIVRPALGADGKPKDQAGSKVGMGDELRALLQGYPNDLDLAFAACLADVDNDTTADAFALFLESWRNGDESFYRALDRTAGTKGEVFYYDAMLGEFMAKFASGDKKDSIPKKGLQSAHDALHNGFLTYRQYRGLREAFALSLVLPADVKLPKNLTRYETAPTGQFSLRDDVQMLLALSNGAVDEPTRSLVMGAKPMPSPLWSENYEPLQPFFDAFAKKLDEINAAYGSPQAAIAKYRERRGEASKKIAEIARTALIDAGCPASKPH
jgi:hypothetical protein